MGVRGSGTFVNGMYKNVCKPVYRGSKKLPYLRISAGPLRGKYVHILVAEARLGRDLTPDETVDHLNGDTLDTRWENLEVVSWAEHGRRTRARDKARKTNGANGDARETDANVPF